VREGWNAVEAGDLGRAREAFSRAVDAGGGAAALHGRAYVAQQSGDMSGATRDYCAALASGPSDDIRAEAEAFLQRSRRSCN
jgi:Tfp pilus assembly protein PilF